jgi:hypothetical protein
MTILTNQQATLGQAPTTLYSGGWGRARVTITGVAGESMTVPLHAISRLPFAKKQWFDGTQAELGLFGGTIEAKAPAGVGSLDIVYELRTGGDVPSGRRVP